MVRQVESAGQFFELVAPSTEAEWVHVAVVNDPADQTVTMYLDGVPILRNVLNVTGIQHDDAKP